MRVIQGGQQRSKKRVGQRLRRGLPYRMRRQVRHSRPPRHQPRRRRRRNLRQVQGPQGWRQRSQGSPRSLFRRPYSSCSTNRRCGLQQRLPQGCWTLRDCIRYVSTCKHMMISGLSALLPVPVLAKTCCQSACWLLLRSLARSFRRFFALSCRLRVTAMNCIWVEWRLLMVAFNGILAGRFS